MAKSYRPIKSWYDREHCINDSGYILVMVPEHPKSFNGGWYYEHRLVAEKRVNRVLMPWETIHHISGDKTDNTWLNLFICTREEHNHAL